MSSTTLPVCPNTGSTSPSLTVHLCLHTAPGNRECARAYLAADTLTWRGVDIWILCIHRIHGPEDARIVAAGNPNTEKKERQVHGNPGRIAARHTKSGRNMNQERTAVDGGRQGV